MVFSILLLLFPTSQQVYYLLCIVLCIYIILVMMMNTKMGCYFNFHQQKCMLCLCVCVRACEYADRESDMQKNRQKERQAGRHACMHTGRQADRQRGSQGDRRPANRQTAISCEFASLLETARSFPNNSKGLYISIYLDRQIDRYRTNRDEPTCLCCDYSIIPTNPVQSLISGTSAAVLQCHIMQRSSTPETGH